MIFVIKKPVQNEKVISKMEENASLFERVNATSYF